MQIDSLATISNCCILGVLLGAVSQASAEESNSEKLDRRQVKLPGLIIDLQHKHVDLEAHVCINNGYLELIACGKGSKEHESIVAVTARPMHIHTALLLIGARNGHPAMLEISDGKSTRWISSGSRIQGCARRQSRRKGNFDGP